MPGATDLNSLCEELLVACMASLDTIPSFDASLAGAPDRSFVSPGQPALDCCDTGQLTVHAAAVNDAPTQPGGLAAGNRNRTGKVNHVTLLVTIGRCIPVADDDGNPPSASELETAAAQTNADVWALWNHLFNLWGAGNLFSACGEVFFDGFRPLPPSDCAGWVGAFRVRLDGYEETL